VLPILDACAFRSLSHLNERVDRSLVTQAAATERALLAEGMNGRPAVRTAVAETGECALRRGLTAAT
jgi:hypothetical protein